mmetsp:Transcript_128440/g.256561  ORF Transcript_128440/g.256561 Transcript_128440/m.256561 type:complete len:437 (-) Transcript_128440:8-1318(-)|eukprot:CAMPEP_0172858870 /NCGR_PEP_ID=MMETSP1075-20121228/68162_1 /TAXON_ID=2916 /ORGANISM="Ceratium fusus, Strain PA161109" /LENGTH=436 /DNA_ID=CAMNT_0013706525 /DNA_START=142 /DNA_END=1449 /DNA_ORIENTATION=+
MNAGMGHEDSRRCAAPNESAAAAAACPLRAVQEVGERFAQLYYGLFAIRPSALRQFYHEGSLMSRNWCSANAFPPGEPQQTSSVHKGMSQIMNAIMASVGGQDPAPGTPVVVTQVEHVQTLLLPDKSGMMLHITGFITFLRQGQMRRFSQAVLLEPSPESSDIVHVRNDIVHYMEALAPLGPGVHLGQQQSLVLDEQVGMALRPQQPRPQEPSFVAEGCAPAADRGDLAVLPGTAASEVLTPSLVSTSLDQAGLLQQAATGSTAVRAAIGTSPSPPECIGEMLSSGGPSAVQQEQETPNPNVAAMQQSSTSTVGGGKSAGASVSWAAIAGAKGQSVPPGGMMPRRPNQRGSLLPAQPAAAGALTSGTSGAASGSTNAANEGTAKAGVASRGKGRGGGKGGEAGWPPRERGRGWRGCETRPSSSMDSKPAQILGPSA